MLFQIILSSLPSATFVGVNKQDGFKMSTCLQQQITWTGGIQFSDPDCLISYTSAVALYWANVEGQ